MLSDSFVWATCPNPCLEMPAGAAAHDFGRAGRAVAWLADVGLVLEVSMTLPCVGLDVVQPAELWPSAPRGSAIFQTSGTKKRQGCAARQTLDHGRLTDAD